MTLPLRFLLVGGLASAAALRAAEPAPTVDITSEDFNSSSAGPETTSIFTGHVVVVGSNIRITCDQLRAISASKAGPATPPSQTQFKYLLATGHVHIVRADIDANCGEAEMLPARQQITFTHDPVIVDRASGTICRGDPVVLTGFGRDYKVGGKNVRFTSTSASPLKGLPGGADAPPKP